MEEIQERGSTLLYVPAVAPMRIFGQNSGPFAHAEADSGIWGLWTQTAHLKNLKFSNF